MHVACAIHFNHRDIIAFNNTYQMKTTNLFFPSYFFLLTSSLLISLLGLHLSLYKHQMSNFIAISHAMYPWELTNLLVHTASEYKRRSNGRVSTRDKQSDNHRLHC